MVANQRNDEPTPESLLDAFEIFDKRGLGRISTPGGGLGQIHWLGRAQGPGLALERSLSVLEGSQPYSGSILLLGRRKEKNPRENDVTGFRYFRLDSSNQ